MTNITAETRKQLINPEIYEDDGLIEEANKVIEKFMKVKTFLVPTPSGKPFVLAYHRSWDLLMPVIVKLKSTHMAKNVPPYRITIVPDIIVMHELCLRLIKLLNFYQRN